MGQIGIAGSTAALLRAEAAAARSHGEALLAMATRLEATAASLEEQPRDELVPIEGAAEMAHVRVRVLEDEERKGRLRIERAGRQRLIARAELDRWLALAPPRRGRPPAPAPENETSELDAAAERIRRSA